MSAGTRSGITSAATCDPDSRRPRCTADRPLWSTERTVSGRWSCECKRMSFTVREKRKPETVPLRTPKRFPCYGVKFRGTSRKSCLKILDFVCPSRNETSPQEERISIYLFGRSRVGTAIPKVVTVSRVGGQTALKQRRFRRPAAPPRCEASLECGDSSPLSSRASLLCGHVHKQGNNSIGKRS